MKVNANYYQTILHYTQNYVPTMYLNFNQHYTFFMLNKARVVYKKQVVKILYHFIGWWRDWFRQTQWSVHKFISEHVEIYLGKMSDDNINYLVLPRRSTLNNFLLRSHIICTKYICSRYKHTTTLYNFSRSLFMF